MKDIERKMWKPSERWRKRRGWGGQDINRSYEENKQKVLEGGGESEEGWIENGRDSERCKWMVGERKRCEEKMG